MYLSHFSIAEMPFGLTPDTAFAFPARSHQEALNTLLMACEGGEGFIKITGEVGTGKTLLCRRFLATLSADTVSCYLPNPQNTPRTLLLAVAGELGQVLPASCDEFSLLKRIDDKLLELAGAGKRVVVCVDEAQGLKQASLETLRLLSNLETEKRKLMQVVLFGQPELDAQLAMPNLRQLRQRISFHYRLGSFSREELRLYLDHRLRVAGYRGPEVFSRGAIAALHRASGGTPRLVNILAHKALLTVYGAGGVTVARRHVRDAARDTDRLAPSPFEWFRRIFR